MGCLRGGLQPAQAAAQCHQSFLTRCILGMELAPVCHKENLNQSEHLHFFEMPPSPEVLPSGDFQKTGQGCPLQPALPASGSAGGPHCCPAENLHQNSAGSGTKELSVLPCSLFFFLHVSMCFLSIAASPGCRFVIRQSTPEPVKHSVRLHSGLSKFHTSASGTKRDNALDFRYPREDRCVRQCHLIKSFV